MTVNGTVSINDSSNDGLTVNTGGTLKGNGTVSSPVYLSGGTLAGSLSLAGNVTSTRGSFAPGETVNGTTHGTIGALAITGSGTLSLDSNSKLYFDLGANTTGGTTYDQITVGGAVALGGAVITPFPTTGFGVGNYSLMTYGSYSGTISLSSTSLTYNGTNYSLALTPNSTYLNLSVTAPTTYTWSVASGTSGNWGVNSSWTPNTGFPGSIDTAAFNMANNNEVNLEAAHSVSTVSLGSNTGGSLTINGSSANALTIANGFTVVSGQTLTGTATINTPSVLVNGGGQITGSLNFGGTVTPNGGSINMTGGSIVGNLNFNGGGSTATMTNCSIGGAVSLYWGGSKFIGNNTTIGASSKPVSVSIGGSLDVFGGKGLTVYASTFDASNGGNLFGSFTVNGTVNLDTNYLYVGDTCSGGTIVTGGIGLMHFTGNVTQDYNMNDAGTYYFDLGKAGTGGTDYDQIKVDGTFDVSNNGDNGTVYLTAQPGFASAAGANTYALMTAGNLVNGGGGALSLAGPVPAISGVLSSNGGLTVALGTNGSVGITFARTAGDAFTWTGGGTGGTTPNNWWNPANWTESGVSYLAPISGDTATISLTGNPVIDVGTTCTTANATFTGLPTPAVKSITLGGIGALTINGGSSGSAPDHRLRRQRHHRRKRPDPHGQRLHQSQRQHGHRPQWRHAGRHAQPDWQCHLDRRQTRPGRNSQWDHARDDRSTCDHRQRHVEPGLRQQPVLRHRRQHHPRRDL